MSRKQLFLRLLVKAAWVRKERAVTALLSVAVAALIATVILTVYSDVGSKLSREFRGFGANAVITSKNGLDDSSLQQIRTVLRGGSVVPVAYAVVNGPSNTKVVLGGADLKALSDLNSWWSVLPAGNLAGNALLGSRVAARFSPAGSSFEVQYGRKTATIQPQAVFNSGSEDDSRIYIALPQFVELTGVQPSTALVRIDGRPEEVQRQIGALAAALPQAQVKPVRQITAAQSAVVTKTHSVVLWAAGVVIVLITLCMLVTFTSSVLERRKDFAVMKALGASNRTVSALFAAEATMLAIVGGIAGFAGGSAVAWWIGKVNFGAAIAWQPALLLPVVLGCIALALIASGAPMRVLQRIQPAGILRGE